MVDARRAAEDRRARSRAGGCRATDEPTPLHHLTTKQRVLLEQIARFCALTGEACSANWLARQSSVDDSTIRQRLEALYRHGWLNTPNAPATLRQPLL